METEHPRWVFERVDPGKSGSSGKITDLFRNESDEARGLFATGAPPYAATLMAREVIQNSWDAAAELQRDDAGVQAFAIDFGFEELDGGEKEDFDQALDLVGLRDRVTELGLDEELREKLGLAERHCLASDSRSTLRLCRVVEHGAVGMYGPWRGADSRMYLAMLSIGYNEKADGSGGTFGYGKAGLIRASSTRVIIAYSCFRAREDDPGVTRRLLGVTYWGQYSLNGESFNGFARFGHEQEDGSVVPLENEAADQVAKALGISLRDPDVPEQLGTTFLIVDPVVEPDDLREAIERNWWPAINEGRFVIQVVGYGGDLQHCRPRVNPKLASFIEAFESVTSGAAPEDGLRLELGHYQPQGGERLDLGTLVLVADPAGWSFPSDDEPGVSSERSLIALMRDPRMVVEYHLPGDQIAKRTPFVRGVYVASPDLNHHLARTEPKGHERWETRAAEEVSGVSTRYAAEVLKRIRSAVTEFQEQLRPEADTSKAVRLPRFDERLRQLKKRTGRAPKPVPAGDRLLELRLATRREHDQGAVRVKGHVDARLKEGRDISDASVTIRFALALDEDGRRGDLVPLRVDASAGTSEQRKAGTFVTCRLTREWSRFSIESDAYRPDWTSRLRVERVDDSAGDEAGSS